MKYIVITTGNGDKYGLPLELVAKKRAEEICKEDKDTTIESEFDFCMNDSFEGIDWFRNNQNPEDYKESDYVLLHKEPTKPLFEIIQDAEDFEIENYDL